MSSSTCLEPTKTRLFSLISFDSPLGDMKLHIFCLVLFLPSSLSLLLRLSVKDLPSLLLFPEPCQPALSELEVAIWIRLFTAWEPCPCLHSAPSALPPFSSQTFLNPNLQSSQRAESPV